MHRPYEPAHNILPPGSLFKLPAVLTPRLQYQSLDLPKILRLLKHPHDRKSHTQYCSTSSHIHLSNSAFEPLEMAQSQIDARSTRESGRSAIFRSIKRTDADVAVIVTGRRVISGDHSWQGTTTGGSFYCRFD